MGVDTHELEWGLPKVTVATQTEREMAGREERGRAIMEAGIGEIKGGVDVIPGGWEMIWVEDSWTRRWEKVQDPQEEADYRRRKGLPLQPSFWRESEAREWHQRLREEKETVEREERENRLWHMEEARRRGFLMDSGPLFEEKKTPIIRGGEMRRQSHY